MRRHTKEVEDNITESARFGIQDKHPMQTMNFVQKWADDYFWDKSEAKLTFTSLASRAILGCKTPETDETFNILNNIGKGNDREHFKAFTTKANEFFDCERKVDNYYIGMFRGEYDQLYKCKSQCHMEKGKSLFALSSRIDCYNLCFQLFDIKVKQRVEDESKKLTLT